MANINFPENRISGLVRKTLDEYNDEITRGWTKKKRKEKLPPFMPYHTGKQVFNYGFGEMEPELVCYVPFKKLDQLDTYNTQCVNHDLYKLLHRFKREKEGAKLDEQEALGTFNVAYACTLDALNHSHPETRYNEYFEEYYFTHADVEVIKAFVYVLLSAERHRFAHTALLLEDLEYSDRQGTIRYFAKALGIPFAASATGHEGDGEEQNADAPAQESGAKPRTKPMIFKNEDETLRWAKVVNETLAGTIEDRFVNRRCTPQLLSIVYFDYWWGYYKAYKGGKLPSVPKLLYFFTAHCGFTADTNAQGEYKNAGNGINDHKMREGGKPKINDKTKKTYPSLWSKIKEAVEKNT
jgi:hypothetical protein